MELIKDVQLLKSYFELQPANKLLKCVDTLVLYFNASWCKCENQEQINTLLRALHEEIQKNNVRMEIIYIPFDKDETSFYDFYKKQGKWLALPLCYETLIFTIMTFYGIFCIPEIVVIRKKTGEIVTTKGVRELLKYGTDALVAWV